MRLIHLQAIAIVVIASPAFGQTQLDRFEGQTKSGTAGTAGPASGAPGVAFDDPEPGWLGLEPNELDKSGKGTPVVSVRKDSPAEKGGLRAGDLITAINGKPCRTVDDLDAALATATVGTKLTMTILRLGKTETKTVTLGRKPEAAPTGADPAASDPLPAPPARTAIGDPPPAATPPTLRSPFGSPPAAAPPAANREPTIDLPPPPDAERPTPDPLRLRATPANPAISPPAADAAPDSAAPAATGKASLGIQVVPLNDETRLQYDVRSSVRQGALIVRVHRDSPADTAGLPLLGVIVTIDGQLVRTSDDLVDAVSAMSPGKEVELRYYQGERMFTKNVRLGEAAARAIVTSPRPGLTFSEPGGPLTREFEGLLDSPAAPARGAAADPLTARPAVGTGVADASRVADLQDHINMLISRIDGLQESLNSLRDRVKQLEAKSAPPPPNPNP